MKRWESEIGIILSMTKETWDTPTFNPWVRDTFRKVSLCRTQALGAEVFASDDGSHLIVCHTCKSWACCSCGNRQTLDWQREQRATLPDIPFIGFTFTLPSEFRKVIRQNPEVRRSLPALGAAAIEGFALSRYGVRILVLVVMQTFGGSLNYHPHLHIMASVGGLRDQDGTWLNRIDYDIDALRELWKVSVLGYLKKAFECGHLAPESSEDKFLDALQKPVEGWYWHVYASKVMTKEHFLGYAGRYIRRPPIAQKRIISITQDEVIFMAKLRRGQPHQEISMTPQEFVTRLAWHVPDRYQNTMGYFGLLAPRTKDLWMGAVFAALNQTQRPKPKRLSHEDALVETFKRNPYLDSQGNTMRWLRSIPPQTL